MFHTFVFHLLPNLILKAIICIIPEELTIDGWVCGGFFT